MKIYFPGKEEQNPEINSTLEVYFFYVGQGEATFIKNDEHTMLIDAGNNPDGKNISKYLRNKLNIKKLDYLIATHSHEDHIGGIDIIIEDFNVEHFYMPAQTSDNKSYTDVIEWANKKKLDVVSPSIGTKFNLGDAKCEIMSKDDNTEDLNESSIVLQLTFGNQKFLFTGDMEATNEESRRWEDIDVLKVSHHGSTYTSTQDFLKQVKPEIAVISCGKNNDYYYPHEAVLKRLQDVGCDKIYVTSEVGTVLIKCDGKSCKVETLKDIDLDGNKN